MEKENMAGKMCPAKRRESKENVRGRMRIKGRDKGRQIEVKEVKTKRCGGSN